MGKPLTGKNVPGREIRQSTGNREEADITRAEQGRRSRLTPEFSFATSNARRSMERRQPTAEEKTLPRIPSRTNDASSPKPKESHFQASHVAF